MLIRTRGVSGKVNTENESIEQILESAVVVSWADLMGRRRNGLIHIEYGCADDGTLEYLRFWSSVKRGYWLLACSYWMSASQSHRSGVLFDNGCESQALARILEVVMQHQNLFALPMNLARPQGLLQIAMPTEDESAAAAEITYALNHVKELGDLLSTGRERSLPLTA